MMLSSFCSICLIVGAIVDLIVGMIAGMIVASSMLHPCNSSSPFNSPSNASSVSRRCVTSWVTDDERPLRASDASPAIWPSGSPLGSMLMAKQVLWTRLTSPLSLVGYMLSLIYSSRNATWKGESVREERRAAQQRRQCMHASAARVGSEHRRSQVCYSTSGCVMLCHRFYATVQRGGEETWILPFCHQVECTLVLLCIIFSVALHIPACRKPSVGLA